MKFRNIICRSHQAISSCFILTAYILTADCILRWSFLLPLNFSNQEWPKIILKAKTSSQKLSSNHLSLKKGNNRRHFANSVSDIRSYHTHFSWDHKALWAIKSSSIAFNRLPLISGVKEVSFRWPLAVWKLLEGFSNLFTWRQHMLQITLRTSYQI